MPLHHFHPKSSSFFFDFFLDVLALAMKNLEYPAIVSKLSRRKDNKMTPSVNDNSKESHEE